MVVTALSLVKEFHSLRTETAFRKTFSTGYSSLDEIVKLVKGRMMVVTGYPGCGKSEWLDAVLVNASLLHGWKTLYFSPENYPIQEHVAKLAEKITGKWVRQLGTEEANTILKFLNLHFAWVDIDREMPSIDMILERALERKEGLGLDCVVIDPWNGAGHPGFVNQREDQYLAEILTKTSYFARRHQLLMAIVAHPKTQIKTKEGKLPRCTVSDISGGSMWWNKVDYAVVCHREDRAKNQIEVELAKIKEKWFGTLGARFLDYDRKTGRFKCVEDKEFALPAEMCLPGTVPSPF